MAGEKGEVEHEMRPYFIQRGHPGALPARCIGTRQEKNPSLLDEKRDRSRATLHHGALGQGAGKKK